MIVENICCCHFALRENNNEAKKQRLRAHWQYDIRCRIGSYSDKNTLKNILATIETGNTACRQICTYTQEDMDSYVEAFA